MVTNKPHSHMLEYVISFLMLAFGVAVGWIFVSAMKSGMMTAHLAIIELMMIVVLLILAQTVILIRIYDQH